MGESGGPAPALELRAGAPPQSEEQSEMPSPRGSNALETAMSPAPFRRQIGP